MSMSKDIARERQVQLQQYTIAEDDLKTLYGWVSVLDNYVDKLSSLTDDGMRSRHTLIQIATIAAAALEAYDRNDGFPNRVRDEDSLIPFDSAERALDSARTFAPIYGATEEGVGAEVKANDNEEAFDAVLANQDNAASFEGSFALTDQDREEAEEYFDGVLARGDNGAPDGDEDDDVAAEPSAGGTELI